MMTTKYNVSAERFIEEWRKHKALGAVATALSMPVSAVKSRAAYYRQIGIKLRKYRNRNPNQLDVMKLNRLASGRKDQQQQQPENPPEAG